jgi:hypothetical protein
MTDKFFTYRAATETPDLPPPDCAMTRDEWVQLTPGYRREIWRGYERAQKRAA